MSCRKNLEACLAAISQKQNLNAFLTVRDADTLRREADAIDQKAHDGNAGRLSGVIMGIKDAICVADVRMTAGSKILENYISPYSATVIERLRAADALIIGKTNLDEFAMGSSNENSAYGPARNPIDPERVAGGSSGGSAVAVAAGMCNGSLGSETGGSVRLPASFCGVVGLKPTYGRVSRYGLAAFASSFDQIGPMAKTVRETAAITSVIAGQDPRDSTTAPVAVPTYVNFCGGGVRGLRIGVPKEYFGSGMEPAVQKAIEQTIRGLAAQGAEICDISLPHTEYGIATYYILVTAEASSNLARYDGVRYTHRAKKSDSAKELFVESRSEAFGSEVKRRIMLGTYVLSAGYYDAYYRRAQKVRTLIKRDFVNAFTGDPAVDCIVAPTSPTVAFRLGEKVADPLAMYLSDVYTVNINIAGVPALSVPVGVDSDKMPIGIQVIGNFFDESLCFRVGQTIEDLSK